jgi:hypothetical protein
MTISLLIGSETDFIKEFALIRLETKITAGIKSISKTEVIVLPFSVRKSPMVQGRQVLLHYDFNTFSMSE